MKMEMKRREERRGRRIACLCLALRVGCEDARI